MVMNNGFTLFLDFDGVLVTKFSVLKKDGRPSFDPECMDVLNELLGLLREKYSDVDLVVTSNWCWELGQDEIRRLLLNEYKLLSVKNEIQFLDPRYSKLEGMKQYININQIKDGKYLILDDERMEGLEEHQLQTRSEDGLRGLQAHDVINR